MSHRNSYAAISEINSWTVDDVQTVLYNNGLESTCAAFRKREIDGENLLNLTEGKLALWKRDLTLVEIRKLAHFVNDLNTSPERFQLLKHGRQNGSSRSHQQGSPQFPPLPPRPSSPGSDTGSWGTDFEDDHDPQSTEDVYSEPPEDNHPPIPAKPSGGLLYSNKSSDRNVTKTNPSFNRSNGGFHQSNQSSSSSADRNVTTASPSFNKPNGGFLNSSKSLSSSDRNAPTTTNQSYNPPKRTFLPSNKLPSSSDRHVATTNQSSNSSNGGFLHSNRQVMTGNQSLNSSTGGNLYTRSPSLTAQQNMNDNRESIKPPIPNRPAAMATRNGGCPPANTSALFGLPKPPTPPTLERLISILNIPDSNRQESEYFEEDEYTSIEEGSNPQSLGFPPSQGVATQQRPVQLPPRKVTPSEQPRIELPPRKIVPVQQLPVELPARNIIPAKQPPIGLPPRKLTPTQQPPFDLPRRKLTPTEQPSLEQIRAASPNPYPKFSFGTSRSRPPAVSPIVSLGGETHFNNIPAGIPNQMSALSNSSKSFPGLKAVMPLPASSPGSSQSLDKLGLLTASIECLNTLASEGDAQESYYEEEYEIIEDKSQRTDYYLQPLIPSTTPLLVPKPSRPPAVPPEIITPSSRPPSPPRKKSFPDEANQDLADKLKVELRRRALSTNSTNDAEREKSPMPDLQKPPPAGLGPRPLPPTPDAARKPGSGMMNPHRNSRNLSQMPWYHNVDRKRAEEMLTNGEDGKFVLRPSTQTQNPLTLTLWYNKRLYNISVRQRTDQRYALGTEKSKEQSFSSVEELVQYYQGEELVLHSKGERTGKTLLTSSPPRQSS